MPRTNASPSQLLEQFSGVVDSLYVAALDPSKWSLAMKEIARLYACDKSLLFTPTTLPEAGGIVFPHGFTESFLQLWATKYIDKDLWTLSGIAKGLFREGEVLLGDDLVQKAHFEGSEIYRDLLAPHDIRHLCTGVIFDGSQGSPALTGVSVFRGVNAADFTELDRRLHVLTTRHASRAVGTMFRLRDAELRLAANIAALDRLSCAVLLFGTAGSVTFANRAAMKVIERGDGLRLRPGNPLTDGLGWLSASNLECDASVKNEINASLRQEVSVSHFSKGVVIRRTSGQRPYFVQFSNLAPENEFSTGERQSLAIAFVTDPESTPRLDGQMLRQTFGMTSAEVTLAQELLAGDSLEEISHRIGASKDTVKTHLQHIYEKTNTHRQAQLVRLLMGLASTTVV